MTDTLRLFVAIELPDSVIRALETVQDRVRQIDTERAIRWSAGDGFHLTLKFLGETPTERLPTIGGVLTDAVRDSKIAPFGLSTDGLGGFPDVLTPRTVWAGVRGDMVLLRAVQKIVESAIAPLGFPSESHPFSPHLTLGRAWQNVPRAKLAAFGRKLASLDIGEISHWQVEAVSLMKSELRPSGAVYTELATCRLNSEKGNSQ
ncbi:MAG: RNA 2',3'-cyclic phosphodiesterase [Aggregatilineales bacterium]